MDGICICEGVGEDLRYRAWHVDNHRETSMFYMNVCDFMALHMHLGGK